MIINGKPLLGFKAARAHLSVYPFSPQAVAAARAELDGFDLAKGTVRFTAAKPLPDGAVRTLVRARLAEITA
ncbi:iron chaperone [Luedemannella flava]